MMGMRGIRMGMWRIRMRIRGIGVGMPGIRVGMQGIGGRDEGNQGENLHIGVEKMNKKMWKGKYAHLSKYSFGTLL